MVGRFLVGLLPHLPRTLVSRVASRYVAGESIKDAVRVTADLNRQGCRVTLAALGEHSDREQSRSTVEAYLELLDRIQSAGVDATVSVKPTHVGLDVNPEFCLENLRRLVEAAEDKNSFVRIDMENRHTTDPALEIYRRLREERSNLGIVLQSCMRRTADDVASLPAGSANVRVCKGIYVEPAEVAFQSFDRIRREFVDTVAVVTITHFYASALPIDAGQAIWPQLWVFIGSGYVFEMVVALLDTIPFYLGVHYLSRYLEIDPMLEHRADEEELRLDK